MRRQRGVSETSVSSQPKPVVSPIGKPRGSGVRSPKCDSAISSVSPRLSVDIDGHPYRRIWVIQWAQSAAREIVLDRIACGELPPDSADAVFDIAA
jgi:hypothetical protein